MSQPLRWSLLPGYGFSLRNELTVWFVFIIVSSVVCCGCISVEQVPSHCREKVFAIVVSTFYLNCVVTQLFGSSIAIIGKKFEFCHSFWTYFLRSFCARNRCWFRWNLANFFIKCSIYSTPSKLFAIWFQEKSHFWTFSIFFDRRFVWISRILVKNLFISGMFYRLSVADFLVFFISKCICFARFGGSNDL